MTGTALTDQSWLSLFESFIGYLRIPSKEGSFDDDADLATLTSSGVPLKLWGSQRRYMTEIASGLESGIRTFYCLKNRQAGISTVSLAIDIFWLAMFPGIQGVIVTDTDANRMKFRALIKAYVASFPRGFFGSSFSIIKGKDNKEFTAFSNGSTLDYLVAGKRVNKTLGEGRGYSFAHCTEIANYGSPEGLQSFRETLAEHHPNRLFIYESTAKGYNHWKDIYEEGRRDTITKKSFFIGWWAKELNRLNPRGPQPEPRLYHIYSAAPPSPEEREKMKIVMEKYNHAITLEQLAWYRWKSSDTSATESDLHQNQPWYEEEAFVLSGQSFFQTRLLQKELDKIQTNDNGDGTTGIGYQGFRFFLGNNFLHSKMEQVEKDISLVTLRVWEEPDLRGTYVIGCDPAFGRNDWKDRHGISVWRCYADMLVQVAEYADSKVETRECAWVLAFIMGAYRNALLNIELSGGAGLAVLSEFKSLRNQLNSEAFEETIRDTVWVDFLAQARWYLYRKYDSTTGGSNSLIHWKTTRDNKFEIMNQLRDTHMKNELKVYSLPLIEEMLTVAQEGGTIEAPGRNKDDRVMAAALATRAWIDMVRPSMLAANATYANVQKGLLDDEYSGGAAGLVNRKVIEFLKRKEEEGDNPVDAVPKWMRERGLA